MDTTSLPILLAFASLVFGIVAAAIFVYIVLPRRRRRAQANAQVENATPPPMQPAEPPTPDPSDSSSKKVAKKITQHSLFVIFDQPDATTDERLTEWLKSKGARYDAIKKIFLIDGQQASNPITIANAFPPGEMPDLLRGETYEPIRGVSLLVKPPLRKRRNQQMHVYVALAKEIHDAFGSQMLDADRQPASDATYEQIIG